MKQYLKRVIPVMGGLEPETFRQVLEQIRPFVKEMEPGEGFQGSLLLVDTPKGVRQAKELGLPCLGLEMGQDCRLEVPYVVTDPSALTGPYLERVYRRFYGIPWDILETERCRIREWEKADAASILEVYEDLERFSISKPFRDQREGEAYLEQYRDRVYRLYEYGLWAAEKKDTKELAGIAGLENQSFEEGDFLALGYVIGKKWRRQGYGQELGQGILEYADRHLGVKQVHCFVEPENTGSLHLAKRLGFYAQGYVTKLGTQERLCCLVRPLGDGGR
jgi:RimJ/RimL family protein N-acetyltransferase